MEYSNKQQELRDLRQEMISYIKSISQANLEGKIHSQKRLEFVKDGITLQIIVKDDKNMPYCVTLYYCTIKDVVIKYYKIPCYKEAEDCELEILNDICENIYQNLK